MIGREKYDVPKNINKDQFIAVYDSLKNQGSSEGASISIVLELIKENRQALIGNDQKQKGIGWRGDWKKGKLFYNLSKSRSNLQVIDELLQSLKEIPTEDCKTILATIQEKIGNLSSGETKTFLNYVVNQLISISQNERISPAKSVIASQKDEIKFINHQEILQRKNLNPKLFQQNNIQFNASLSEHVKWAFQNIYSVPYPNHPLEEGKPPRIHHGIEHVSRAMAYVSVLANLYERHYGTAFANLGDSQEERELNLKLIQLAVLFHDSAREGENKDEWDHESALFFYYYLTETLQLPHEKAKLFAEAIANKDPLETGYSSLNKDKNGNLSWQTDPSKDKKNKNIFQKLIHDADCLDIIRARDRYDGRHLDFFKDRDLITDKAKQKTALKEMGLLIAEARSLIDVQGDTRNHLDFEIKKKYENENAYIAIEKDIKQNKYQHKIIPSLYADGNLLPTNELTNKTFIRPFNKTENISEQNLEAALADGKVFIRGVFAPSGISKKQKLNVSDSEAIDLFRKVYEFFGSVVIDNVFKDKVKLETNQDVEQKINLIHKQLGSSTMIKELIKKLGPEIYQFLGPEIFETSAGLELRKVYRELNIPTRTNKMDKEMKHGNLLRSTSMIGYGGSVYSSAGFIFLDPPINSIHGIDTKDNDSGRGKRGKIHGEKLLAAMNLQNATAEERQKALEDMQNMLLMGGPDPRTYTEVKYKSTHVEIITDIFQYDAIYFSPDRCIMNMWMHKDHKPYHANASILQAIYLQNEYQRQYELRYQQRKEKYEKKFGEYARIEYEKQYPKKTLPIFEYSGTNHFIKAIDQKQLTDEFILSKWEAMVTDYIVKQLSGSSPHSIFTIPLNSMSKMQESAIIHSLKLLSMYGVVNKTIEGTEQIAPADLNYSPELRKKISAMTMQKYVQLRTEHSYRIVNAINNEKTSIFNDKVFFDIVRDPDVLKNVKEEATKQIQEALKNLQSDALDLKFAVNFFDEKADPQWSNFSTYSLEELLKIPDANTKYYQKNILKLLELAEKLNLKDEHSKIQDRAVNHAEKLISSIDNQLKSNADILPVIANLNSLINYVHSFKIQEHLFIKENINKLFDQITSKFFEKTNDLKTIKTFLQFLKENNKLNKEEKSFIVDKYIIPYEKLIAAGLNNEEKLEIANARYPRAFNLSYYLEIAQLLDIPLERQKDVAIQSLEKSGSEYFTFSSNAFTDLCAKLSKAGLIEDTLPFIHKHIKLDPQDSNTFKKMFTFFKALPDKLVTKELKEMFTKQINDAIDAHVNPILSGKNSVDKFHHYEQFVSHYLIHTRLFTGESLLKNEILIPLIDKHVEKLVDLLIQLPQKEFVEKLRYPFLSSIVRNVELNTLEMEKLQKYILDNKLTAKDLKPVYDILVKVGRISEQVFFRNLVPEDMFKELSAVPVAPSLKVV